MDSRRIALTLILALVARVSSGQWSTNWSTTTNGPQHFLECIQDLTLAAQEKKFISGSDAPIVTASNNVTDGNYTCQVSTVGAWTYTNCYYTYTNSLQTNVVDIKNARTAMAQVDSLIYSIPAGTFVPTSTVADASNWFHLAYNTNWTWVASNSTWYACTTNYRDRMPFYTIGSFEPDFYDAREHTSIVLQCGAGGDFSYAEDVTTNWFTPFGWQVGNLHSYAGAPFAQVVTNYHEQTEMLLVPASAFPTNGIELFRFQYGPAPWRQQSVAWYPAYVTISGSSNSSANGVYQYAGPVTDDSLFDTNFTYVSYENGSAWKLYLGNVDQPFFGYNSYPAYQWGMDQQPSLLTFTEYIGVGADSIAGYSKSGRMNVGYGGSAPLGTNVYLSIPAISGTNWIVETAYVGVQGSALVNDKLYVVYTNYAPPKWFSVEGSTNDSANFLAFDATVEAFEFIAPSISGVTNVVQPSRPLKTNAWSFGSSSVPTMTSHIFSVMIATNDSYYLYGSGVAVFSNAACNVFTDLSESNTYNHWGDAQILRWTNPVALYGQYGAAHGREYMFPKHYNSFYQEALFARRRVLDAMLYSFRADDFLVQQSDSTNGSFSEACNDGSIYPYPCAWPPTAGTVAFSNMNTVAPILADLAVRGFVMEYYAPDEATCDFDNGAQALGSMDAWSAPEITVRKGRLAANIPNLTNSWVSGSNAWTNVAFGVDEIMCFVMIENEHPSNYGSCLVSNYTPYDTWNMWPENTDRKYELYATATGTNQISTTNISGTVYALGISFDTFGVNPTLGGLCDTNRQATSEQAVDLPGCITYSGSCTNFIGRRYSQALFESRVAEGAGIIKWKLLFKP